MVLRDLHVSCVGIQTNLVVTAMKVSNYVYLHTTSGLIWVHKILTTVMTNVVVDKLRVQSVLKHFKLFCNYHNIDIMTIAWHVDMNSILCTLI